MQGFKVRLLSSDGGGVQFAQSECKTKNRLFMFSTTAPCNQIQIMSISMDQSMET
jgi:hypothetical protein